MIPTSIIATKIPVAGVIGSLNTRMPYTNTPTIPIPVHTAYAILIGIVLAASHKKKQLKIIDKTTNINGILNFNPSQYLIATAHIISNIPAINRYSHDIFKSPSIFLIIVL